MQTRHGGVRLPYFVFTVLFAVAHPVQAQTLQSDRVGKLSAASTGTVDAIISRLISQQHDVAPQKFVHSSGWVRSWNLTKTWSKGAWVNMVQNTFTYDVNGYYVNFLWEVRSNGGWE